MAGGITITTSIIGGMASAGGTRRIIAVPIVTGIMTAIVIMIAIIATGIGTVTIDRSAKGASFGRRLSLFRNYCGIPAGFVAPVGLFGPITFFCDGRQSSFGPLTSNLSTPNWFLTMTVRVVCFASMR